MLHRFNMSHPEPSQPVYLAEGSSLQASGGQTEGMIRQNAIVDKCDGICATRMLAKPKSSSAVHHHGEQDTVVYAVKGHASVVSEGGKKRVDLKPGDYALIPAFMEHQEVNDGDEEAVWAIIRSGRIPDVVNLTGWGGEPVKA
ncbi:RmlC-like cupin [Whalleya microplaca]|nr:RmlC-like cupin [Whalleya microplaca]